MIPKECKRVAQVDFPIGVVLKHAARENCIAVFNFRVFPCDSVARS